MNAAEIAALCGFAVAAALMGTLLKSAKPEFAMLAAVAGGAIITVFGLTKLRPVIEYVRELCSSNEYGEYLGLLIKAAGIGYIGCFSSEVCRDAGENALAARVEFAVRAAILLMSMPLIKNIFAYLEEFSK